MNNAINNNFVRDIASKFPVPSFYSAIYEQHGQFYRTPSYSYEVLEDYLQELRECQLIENVKFVKDSNNY